MVNFNGNNGASPLGGLVADTAGDLFGTTSGIGNDSDGTVFEVAAGTYALTTLATFNGTDGSGPADDLLLDSAGDLFGTTVAGGSSNDGTVFEIPAATHVLTTLVNFNGTNGSSPTAGLVQDSAGNIYGTTYSGGSSNSGTVFELAAGTNAMTTLVTFTGTNGGSPRNDMVVDSAGDLFGTTMTGGSSGDGIVFEIAANTHALTTLITFNGRNGATPRGGLVMDSAGNLLGTTVAGGTSGAGTVFELSTSGLFTVTATDTNGASASEKLALSVLPSPTISTTTLPTGNVGQSYNQTISASGGSGFLSYAVTSGSLPPGLTLDEATGNLIGTPTSASGSPYAFTITATDTLGDTGSQNYSVIITGAVGINTTTLPNWTVGQAYSQTISVTDSNSPFTFAVATGSLPTGLSLNSSTGAITGTPTTTSGSPFAFTITVTDAAQDVASQNYSITINAAPTITTTTLASDDVDGNYSQTIAVAGGTGAETFAVSAGNLPAGLSLNSATGAITGTPTTESSHSATPTLTALDSFNVYEDSVGGLLIDKSGNIFGTTGNDGTYGYGTVFEIAAGSQTITTLTNFNGAGNGSSPMGDLIEDSSGNIYGATAYGGADNDGTVFELAAGSHTLTTLASFNYSDGSKPYGGLVEDSNGNLFGTTAIGGGYGKGVVYEVAAGTHALTDLGTFTGTANGANPVGSLYLDSSGNLFGTTQSGGGNGANNTGTVFEVAAGSNSITTLYSFILAVPNGHLVEDSSGNLYGTTIDGGPGGGGGVFEIPAGSHTFTNIVSFSSYGAATGSGPIAGLIIDSHGNLYGDTAEGGASGEGTIFEVAAGTHAFTTLASFNGTTTGGAAYGDLSIDTSGDLYGINFIGGSAGYGTLYELMSPAANFTITATDVTGASASLSYSLPINADTEPTLTTTNLANWTVGQAYNQGVCTTGGTVPLIFTVSAGTLPTGLSLNSGTGAITGTPTSTSGSPFSFTITTTDAVGEGASESYTVAINSAPTITTTTLPNGAVNSAYSQVINVSGGTNPINFGVISGSLPTGLSLNSSTGAITGTPTTASGSPFVFTVVVTDAASAVTTQTYFVTINSSPTITTTILSNWTVNQPYSQTLTVSGGTSPYTFAVTTGSLPTGLTLNTSTGAITGTPTSVSGSPFSFTITTRDAVGDSCQSELQRNHQRRPGDYNDDVGERTGRPTLQSVARLDRRHGSRDLVGLSGHSAGGPDSEQHNRSHHRYARGGHSRCRNPHYLDFLQLSQRCGQRIGQWIGRG